MFEHIILVVEKELEKIKSDYNDFDYQECDPSGPQEATRGYREYTALLNELNELKIHALDSSNR